MADFNLVTIIPPNMLVENSSGDGPVHMAVAADGRVFVARMRTGSIVMHTPPNTNVNIGVIPTWFNNESGLLGIAVGPGFGTTNNWLYAYNSGTSSTVRTRELVRYTVAGNTLTNRKVLLTFNTFSGAPAPYHAGGGMAFTENGVLIIGIGDDTDPHAGNCLHDGWAAVEPTSQDCDAQKSASNTNDLRGGLIRIRPIEFADTQTPAPGIGTTYSIPPGNLRDVITTLPNWGTQNINLVRPEIFAKGTRNAYKTGVDTRSGWIFWGEVGPDAGSNDLTTIRHGYAGQEEWNLTARAGYFGWPYSNGNYFYNGYTANALVNISPFNTGVQNLPPPYLATVWYASTVNAPGEHTAFDQGGETAMTGPMYRYNAASTSTVKFPPYYEGKIFFNEWAGRFIRTIQMNPDATFNTSQAFAPTVLPRVSYIDLQFGTNGALYLLRYSDGSYSGLGTAQVYRLEYTGVISNTCFAPFTATVQGPSDVVGIQQGKNLLKSISPALANGFVTLPVGFKTVEIYDANGKMIWNFHRVDDFAKQDIRLPAHLAKGVWQAKFLP